MKAELYWIEGPWPGRLAILPRPRGGEWLEDEIRSWKQAGVNVVVSLLTSDEIAELGLVEEARLCQDFGLQFLSFPIMDRRVPSSPKATFDFIRELETLLADGKNLAVHCRQGVGRSALIAACLLVLSGMEPEVALQRVGAARGCPVPETTEQRQWVMEFARELQELSLCISRY
jgi:protein-tyrosine phosphatase